MRLGEIPNYYQASANSRNSENKLIQLAHRKQQATILRLVVSVGIRLHLVKIIEKRSEIQSTTVLPILVLWRFLFFIITPKYEALRSWFH